MFVEEGEAEAGGAAGVEGFGGDLGGEVGVLKGVF